MQKHSAPVRQFTRPGTASGLRYLLDEVQMWMVALPDLHDAFDEDNLPLAFILRRDSGDAGADPWERSAPPASQVDQRRTRAVRTDRHGTPRKQMPND
jgi:hypothetical protein